MIYFVTTDQHSYTLEPYLANWARDLTDIVGQLPVSRLLDAETIPKAHYIFTDLDRYNPRQRQSLLSIWLQARRSNEFKMLNHPTQGRLRFELLRYLHKHGVNSFNLRRLVDHEAPDRFPVFVRGTGHAQPVPRIIETAAELSDEIENVEASAVWREGVLIVEYCDVRSADGYFRKHGAFYLDGRVIPRHLLFSDQWFVKLPNSRMDTSLLEEEWEYLQTNPYAAQIRDIFTLARLDYGRIDFSLKDDRIEVWEINTNPILTAPEDMPEAESPRTRVSALFATRFNAALREFNSS